MRKKAITGVAALLILGTAGISLAQDKTDGFIRDGMAFGPEMHFSGVYFSNFENSQFTQCLHAEGGCVKGTEKEPEVVWCDAEACDDLERRIVRLVGSHDKWATYAIDFVGRRSTARTPKRFLGDTENKVYINRIERFELLETE